MRGRQVPTGLHDCHRSEVAAGRKDILAFKLSGESGFLNLGTQTRSLTLMSEIRLRR